MKMVISCYQTDKPGRLPDTGVPAVQNSSAVTDFAWDPFNDSRLAVGLYAPLFVYYSIQRIISKSEKITSLQ